MELLLFERDKVSEWCDLCCETGALTVAVDMIVQRVGGIEDNNGDSNVLYLSFLFVSLCLMGRCSCIYKIEPKVISNKCVFVQVATKRDANYASLGLLWRSVCCNRRFEERSTG